jgi:hypothetical protein
MYKPNYLALGYVNWIFGASVANDGASMKPNTWKDSHLCWDGLSPWTIQGYWWSVRQCLSTTHLNYVTYTCYIWLNPNQTTSMHIIPCHLLYALYSSSILHSLGDEGSEEIVVEDTQEVEIVDKPPKPVQGSPLCILLFANARMNYIH